MPRTVALYLLPAALIATGWARLVDGVDEGAMLDLLMLAVIPALPRPLWARALAALVSSFAAVWIVYRIPPHAILPFEDRHFFGPLASQIRDGVLEFYDVTVPFPIGEHPDMNGAVLLAVFLFCLVLALAVAARRPLIASVALLTGSVWPATLVGGDDLARGALTLAAVLSLFAFGGRRPTRAVQPAIVLAALLVAMAVGASTSVAVAKPEFLRWKDWDFYDKPADPVGVAYVWNANYRALEWPDKETTVLKVRGPRRNLYWRATTLDSFDEDHWVEGEQTVRNISDRAVDLTQLGENPLLPRRAYDRSRWIRSEVEVAALRDRHLVGPSMPVAYDPNGAGTMLITTSGIAGLSDYVPRGARYLVWSYAPQPKPRQLANAGLPQERLVQRYLEVDPNLLPLPAFGTPNREAVVRARLRSSGAVRYEPLYERALQVVGNPRNEYAAVVALEAWFRSEGGFTYDETPPPADGAPPLVAFLRDQHGYCQHFAGAMTLMLRYLGIPARVAVGFTSGELSKDKTTRTVTDHDAHAWVEVWFPGWGWLPFDPTPARAQLSGPYSYSGVNFDAAGAAGVLNASGGGGQTSRIVSKLSEARVGEQFQPDRPTSGRGYVPVVREHGASLIKFLALLAAAAALGIILVKQGIRLRRYLTRDARRLAKASRQELVDFLADQGVTLPRSATPRELADELEQQFSVDADGFARALAESRYATPGASQTAARQLRVELRAVRKAIRRRIGVPRRLRGAVSLRSLTA
jgi:transglutaminase-like putative cysteine protease